MPLIEGVINNGQISQKCQIRFHLRQADVFGMTGAQQTLPATEAWKSGTDGESDLQPSHDSALQKLKSL